MSHGDEEVVEMTRLYAACATGCTDIVRAFLRVGADVNKTCTDGRTPLHTACLHGHKAIVGMLLRVSNIDVNPISRTLEQTPLIFACVFGHTEIVELLLTTPGIDVNKANKSGWTPLHYAGISGNKEMINMLLHAGADMNKVSKDGYTAKCGSYCSLDAAISNLIRGYDDIDDLKEAAHMLTIS